MGTVRKSGEFLCKLVTGLFLAAAMTGPSQAEPSQAEPAMLSSLDNPGPDLPPVGRSLFDFMTAGTDENGNPVYDIPYPFEALTAYLSDYLVTTTTRPLQQVLIPLGRSLQREAAAPHYFAHPRAVVAAEAEPQVRPGAPLIRLKDRLYLGYQEKTGVLEVVSYNEAAGRFEFQVVHDYREGATPDVRYADRGVCAGCHQNLAPIFADEPWSESNSNPAVANALRSVKDSFYGIPAFVGMDIPGLINISAQRANLFAPHQAFWRDGCGRDLDSAAVACRAEAALAALTYRLAADVHEEAPMASPKKAVAETVVDGWRETWPQGIAIMGPLVPDREPGSGPISRALLYSEQADRTPLTAIPAAELATFEESLEPLYPREPKEVWRAPRSFGVGPSPNAPWMKRWVAGLGDFFAPQDITAIDEALAAAAADRPAIQYHGRCRWSVDDLGLGGGGGERVTFTCEPAGEPGLSLSVRLDFRDGVYDDGYSQGLRIGFDPTTQPMTFPAISIQAAPTQAAPIQAAPTQAARHPDQGRLALEPRFKLVRGISTFPDTLNSGRHVRLPDGRLVRQLALEWAGDGSARVTAHVVDDIVRLHEAIEAMKADTLAGGIDAFSAKPFRRVGILKPLFARLGIEVAGWCCEDPTGLPPARVEYE